MPTKSSPVEQLDNWIVTLKTVQSICAKQFNGTVSTWTLNKFATAAVILTVGATNVFNFGVAVGNALSEPTFSGFSPGDATTFSDLVDAAEQPGSLGWIVLNLVQAYCAPSCLQPDGSLDEGKTLAEAFPSGSPNWAALTTIVENSNLDAIIGTPATVIAGMKGLQAASDTKIIHDLISYLSTFQ
jgi:hypothetical protein